MKYLKRVFSCFAAAALMCSVSAFAACGSGNNSGSNNNGNNDGGETVQVSDVVTESQWDAVFAEESFYNVTLTTNKKNSEEYSYSKSSSSYTGKTTTEVKQTVKYDLSTNSELEFTGNVYDRTNYKYAYSETNSWGDPVSSEREANSDLYYLYDTVIEVDEYANIPIIGYAYKAIYDGEEDDWITGSVYSVFRYIDNSGNSEYFPYRILQYYSNFEYVDGAYVYSYDYSKDTSYIYDYEELSGSAGFECEVTGGIRTYSVIIQNSKVISIKMVESYAYEISTSSQNVSRTYECDYEWYFSDYGSTSVTVPSEVTALFN